MKQKELLDQCKQNNRTAQAALYEKYKVPLYNLCLKYCKNTEEAEDVMQDSFVAIFTKINQYSGNGSFEGWLKRITINKALDRYKEKRNKREREGVLNASEILSVENPDIIEAELSGFTLDQLLTMVQQLPHQYRLVFTLYELDNHSHAEISQLLDISVNTSKSNLHRAKKQLKEAVKTAKKSISKYG